MSKECSCGEGCSCDLDFQAPMEFLDFLRQEAGGNPQTVAIAWEREDGYVSRYDIDIPRRIAPDIVDVVVHTVERCVKFLLWSAGGWKLWLAGPDEIVKPVAAAYTKDGARKFDWEFMSDLYGRQMTVEIVPLGKMPQEHERNIVIKNNTNGNRIGFDLGASDFKISALKEGEVVFSEEFPWDPRNQGDPDYHYKHLSAGLEAAAKALGGKVDAIGGSSAGTFVGKKIGVASLFRAVREQNPDRFPEAQNLFLRIEDEWKVPFEVFNDGDVTALAGAIAMGRNGILGVAMGSSEAVGFINTNGALTGRISELAFAPVDMNTAAPADEWSRDEGVGCMYFSQQAVNHLACKFGFDFPKEMGLPDRLKEVQAAVAKGDDRAVKVYLKIGRYLAETVPWYGEFYDFDNLMILGRVTSGVGGSIILNEARLHLEEFDPELAEKVEIFMPDEKARRLGQSVAAAQIPEIK